MYTIGAKRRDTCRPMEDAENRERKEEDNGSTLDRGGGG